MTEKGAHSGDGEHVRLHDSWKARLLSEFEAPYMRELAAFLRAERAAGKQIYPPAGLIFNALDSTPFDQVRVVILGQDPYHGPGQAHGLCFSVPPGCPAPPSLANICKELQSDLGVRPASPSLDRWAEQGVLLLNSVLTVERGRAASHEGRGWEQFTDRVVSLLNEERDGLVFILWGGYAQRKGRHIDASRHLVLRAPHPSPLSAYRGFFGSRPFSTANQWLVDHGLTPICWGEPVPVPA